MAPLINKCYEKNLARLFVTGPWSDTDIFPDAGEIEEINAGILLNCKRVSKPLSFD